MALTVNHPTLKEVTVYAYSPSVASSPIACYARVPFRGKIVKVGNVISGAVTSANVSNAVAVIPATADAAAVGSPVTVTGSPFINTTTNSGAGSQNFFVPTGANSVKEDDVISFTPSAATGSNITGIYYAVIRTD